MAKKHASDHKPYSPVDAAFMRSLPPSLPLLCQERMMLLSRCSERTWRMLHLQQ
jgi:hypothetical protein